MDTHLKIDKEFYILYFFSIMYYIYIFFIFFFTTTLFNRTFFFLRNTKPEKCSNCKNNKTNLKFLLFNVISFCFLKLYSYISLNKPSEYYFVTINVRIVLCSKPCNVETLRVFLQ